MATEAAPGPGQELIVGAVDDGPPTPPQIAASFERELLALEDGQKRLDSLYQKLADAKRSGESERLRGAALAFEREAKGQRQRAKALRNAAVQLRALSAALPAGRALLDSDKEHSELKSDLGGDL